MTKPNSLQTKESLLLDSSPVWRDDALGYIGGYIVKKLIPSTKCVECVDAMVVEDQTTIPDHLSYTEICPNTSNKLIALKSYHNGALTIPSPSVLKFVHVTDKILRQKLYQWHLLNKKARGGWTATRKASWEICMCFADRLHS